MFISWKEKFLDGVRQGLKNCHFCGWPKTSKMNQIERRSIISNNRSIFLYFLMCAKEVYANTRGKLLNLPEELCFMIMERMVVSWVEAVNVQYRFILEGLNPVPVLFYKGTDVMVLPPMSIESETKTIQPGLGFSFNGIYFKNKPACRIDAMEGIKKKRRGINKTKLFTAFFDALHIKMEQCGNQNLQFDPRAIALGFFCKEPGKRHQNCTVCAFALQITGSVPPLNVLRVGKGKRSNMTFAPTTKTFSPQWGRLALFNCQYELARRRRHLGMPNSNLAYPIGVHF